MNERDAGECVLTKNTCSQSFLCEQHTFKVKFINRICNVDFNNAQKLSANEIRKDTVQQFKNRRKRRRINERTQLIYNINLS